MAGWVAIVERTPRRMLTTGRGLVVDELLEQARQVDPSITEDELTAARLAASEHYRGSPQELACFVDVELTRARERGLTLTEHLAPSGRYGPQGGPRTAATRGNASTRHLAAARAVLGGAAQGIARGATRFFDPRAQDRLHRAWKRGSGHVHSCRAEGTLKAWCFDVPHCERTAERTRRCCADGMPPAGRQGGRSLLEWVGAIPGVDAYRVLLLRPSTGGIAHRQRYESARRLIARRSGVASVVDSPGAGALALLSLGLVV